MDEKEKIMIGYEVDQEAHDSPIVRFIEDQVEKGELDEEWAAEFYRVEWSRSMEKVAKRRGFEDIELVREAFEYYNDS